MRRTEGEGGRLTCCVCSRWCGGVVEGEGVRGGVQGLVGVLHGGEERLVVVVVVGVGVGVGAAAASVAVGASHLPHGDEEGEGRRKGIGEEGGRGIVGKGGTDGCGRRDEARQSRAPLPPPPHLLPACLPPAAAADSAVQCRTGRGGRAG
jgi:hypothetical protein